MIVKTHQATEGIQFWDWTDVTAPVLFNYMKLPGIRPSDYALGAWWLFWQAPYVYVGGSGNGLYVVDATDPRQPVLVNRMRTSQLGGFGIGPVFAVGNLLVLSSMEQTSYATLDISDPRNPSLLATQRDVPKPYSTMVNGNKILTASTDGKLYVHDISDPTTFTLVNNTAHLGGKGGYVTYQDGFAHVGASKAYAKVDIRDPMSYPIVGKGSSGILDRDEDIATVLGNLVFAGNDHGTGSVLMPHQATPDLTGPAVTVVNPKHGATNQALTTRIGVTMSDQIDASQVDLITHRKAGGRNSPRWHL